MTSQMRADRGGGGGGGDGEQTRQRSRWRPMYIFGSAVSLPLLLVLLLLGVGAGGVPTSRRRMEHRPSVAISCPPEMEIDPCVCRLRGPEIHIMCEGSEETRVVAAMEALMRRAQPVEELHIIGNRIPVLPARVFGSILINKLFLVNNEMSGIDRNAFAGLESSLQHLHMEEPALTSLPFDTLDHLANLRTCVMENTAVATLPRLYSLSRLEFLKVDGSKVASIPSAAFRFMPNMKKVHIANSHLKEVAANALEGLVYLREINFSHNSIKWVHPRAFRTLNTMEDMVLANNQLTDAAAVVLAARELRQLRHFDLSSNMISHLAKGIFVDMATVAIIDLSNNIISKIDAGTFYMLPTLQKLDLSGNLLQEFHADAFKEPVNLEHLNLARNNLTFMAKLSTLAYTLPALTSLDLSNNHLQVVPGAFMGHPNLQALKLDNNQVQQLQPGVFHHLPNLQELHLSNNLITNDQQQALWDLPELRTIDLSHNELQKVDSTLLEGLPRLSMLDLSFNVIKSIGDNALRGTPRLKNLNMSYNSIPQLPDAVFTDLQHLLEVELSFNELITLQSGILRDMPRLRRLYISHNQISSISPLAFTNSSGIQHLDLSANLLQELPHGVLATLTSLKHLNLQYNALTHLHDHYLLGLHSLDHLDLSHNHIQAVSEGGLHDLGDLRDLDLSVNYLESFEVDMFTGSGAIERLNASHNYLRDLGGAVSDLPRLRILDLTNNSLVNLGREVQGLGYLQGLFLANNYLTQLENTTLEGLEGLNVLRLENNGIQTFQLGTFRSLEALLTLDMTNNNLVELQPDSLASLPALEEVRMGRNQITIIKDFAITNLPALRSLELQDNMISEVGAHGFHQLPSLQFLNLSRNGFQEVPEDSLVRLPSLHVLDLSWNYLLQIKDSTFYPLEALTVLMLHDNDLCQLSSGSFQRQSSLRILTLQNNQLRRLHLHALGSTLAHLALLDMSGNPFHCDCELVWLREYLEEAPQGQRGPRYPPLPPIHSMMRGVPVCAAPKQYQGLPITQVPASAFMCEGRRMKGDSGEMEHREAAEEDEVDNVCHPRYVNPMVFPGDHTGSLDSFLQLNNHTGDGFLDYDNPILVPGIKTPTTTTTTTDQPTAAVQAPTAAVPLSVNPTTTSTRKTQQQQTQQSQSSVHTVTGDTPTIYAGSSGGSNSNSALNEEVGGGLLGGLRLPTLPNLLELAGLAIPHIGLNMNWGVPGLGRHDSGATPNLGPNDSKPMKGPDSSDPLWVEGPASPHPHFVAPPPPPLSDPSPSRGPGTVDGPHINPHHEQAILGPPFPFPEGPGERLKPGVPGVVMPIDRPVSVWQAGIPPPDQQRPVSRPVLPPVLHSGPGPSSGTPFLPGRPVPFLPNSLQIQPHPQQDHQHHSHTSPQPSSTLHHAQQGTVVFTQPASPPVLGESRLPSTLSFSDTGLIGTTPKWSHPEKIHPDSGVSHYQPGEPFLPYNPHHHANPITVVKAPQMNGGPPLSQPGPFPHPDLSPQPNPIPLPSPSIQPSPLPHPSSRPQSDIFQPGSILLPGPISHQPHIPVTPVAHPDMASSETQVVDGGDVAIEVLPSLTPSAGLALVPVLSTAATTPGHYQFTDQSPHHQFTDQTPHHQLTDQTPHHQLTDQTPHHQLTDQTPHHQFTDQTPHHQFTDQEPHHQFTDQTSNHQLTDQTHAVHYLPTPAGPPPSPTALTQTTLVPNLLPSSPSPITHTSFNLPTEQPIQSSPSSSLASLLPVENGGVEEEDKEEEKKEEEDIGTHIPSLGDLVTLLFAAEDKVKHEEGEHKEGEKHEEHHHQEEVTEQGDEEVWIVQPGEEQENQKPKENHHVAGSEEHGHEEPLTHEEGYVEEDTVGTNNDHSFSLPTLSSSPLPSLLSPQPSSPSTTTTTSTTTATTNPTTTTLRHIPSTSASQPTFNRPTPSIPILGEGSSLSEVFPAKLGEGVQVLKNSPPRQTSSITVPPSLFTPEIWDDRSEGNQDQDPTRHRPHPGMVTAVDKSGTPLGGGGNLTYISPSRSMGRGGYPTIERVFQPGQEGQAAHSIAQPAVEAEGSNGLTQPTPTQDQTLVPSETEFEAIDANGIDWYYNNYNREHTSLPVGGNPPPSAASAPTYSHPAPSLVPALTIITLYLLL